MPNDGSCPRWWEGPPSTRYLSELSEQDIEHSSSSAPEDEALKEFGGIQHGTISKRTDVAAKHPG